MSTDLLYLAIWRELRSDIEKMEDPKKFVIVVGVKDLSFNEMGGVPVVYYDRLKDPNALHLVNAKFFYEMAMGRWN